MSIEYIETYTGRMVYPMRVQAADICIEDIAHSLSQMCRYTGHTRQYYSVAEHSVRVSLLVRAVDAAWGLLHDASEAYLTDIPSPLKRLPEFAPYRAAEARTMRAVCERFGLAPVQPASVTNADGILLATEARDLMPMKCEWALVYHPLDTHIDPWDCATAEFEFLKRFAELGIKELRD
jgi:hypothetical protein